MRSQSQLPVSATAVRETQHQPLFSPSVLSFFSHPPEPHHRKRNGCHVASWPARRTSCVLVDMCWFRVWGESNETQGSRSNRGQRDRLALKAGKCAAAGPADANLKSQESTWGEPRLFKQPLRALYSLFRAVRGEDKKQERENEASIWQGCPILVVFLTIGLKQLKRVQRVCESLNCENFVWEYNYKSSNNIWHNISKTAAFNKSLGHLGRLRSSG